MRRLDLGLRLAQLFAQLVERRLVLLERVEAGARLQRLRRQALERLLVLLQLAVGRGQPDGFLLGLRDRVGQRLDAGVDRLELLGPGAGLVQPLGHLVEPRVRLAGLFLDFLERLARRDASLALCSCTCVSMVLSAARSSLEAAISVCSSSDCSFGRRSST